MIFRISVYIVLLLGLPTASNSAINDCYAKLTDGKLILGNSLFERSYHWNEGNLISFEWRDKTNGNRFYFSDTIPDFYLPNEPLTATGAILSITEMASSSKWKAHLAVEIYYKIGSIEVKRLFRIFPDTPALQCSFFFKGMTHAEWINEVASAGDLNNLEVYTSGTSGFSFAPVLEKIEMPGRHWNIRTVRLYDITDRYNTLVKECNEMLYRMNVHKGNLAILRNLENNKHFFILKESPSYFSQLAFPGADFISSTGKIQAIGIGLNPSDLLEDEWIQGYGFVSGFGGNSELETLMAIRKYQKNIFPAYAGYEPVFMINTWGDRAMDKKLGKEFMENEIKASKKLGNNYIQIDDGWQTGLSANSAFEGGTFDNIWESDGYWDIHPDKFPGGFADLHKKAEKAGITLSVWFNPAYKNNYEAWENDAEVLANLFNDHHFPIIKIDGLKMDNKISEQRIRQMFDLAWEQSGHKLSYNLDITAHKRFGYHYFNEYGTYWVANRYTDWRNYYPHATLRNLWLLSRYVPPEKLQMAFCNIWRNTDKYIDDPFAPITVGFDYAFATVMAAQPMGFFEASGLPDKAFEISTIVSEYMQIQKEFHSGIILPIGEEPSGTGWTGFQSILTENTGYLLVFREKNDVNQNAMDTWFSSGSKVQFTKISGQGKNQFIRTSLNGRIKFELPEKNTWALYSYCIK